MFEVNDLILVKVSQIACALLLYYAITTNMQQMFENVGIKLKLFDCPDGKNGLIGSSIGTSASSTASLRPTHLKAARGGVVQADLMRRNWLFLMMFVQMESGKGAWSR